MTLTRDVVTVRQVDGTPMLTAHTFHKSQITRSTINFKYTYQMLNRGINRGKWVGLHYRLCTIFYFYTKTNKYTKTDKGQKKRGSVMMSLYQLYVIVV